MAKISQFATDKEAEVKGRWIEAVGIRMLIARMGNPDYVAFLRRHGKGTAQAIRHGIATDGDKDVEQLVKKAVSKHVLLNWEQLTDDNEQPIPYSPEKALEMFETYPDFFKVVSELANDAANFKDRSTEQDRGNS